MPITAVSFFVIQPRDNGLKIHAILDRARRGVKFTACRGKNPKLILEDKADIFPF
jgi:hypothetical protein